MNSQYLTNKSVIICIGKYELSQRLHEHDIFKVSDIKFPHVFSFRRQTPVPHLRSPRTLSRTPHRR